MELEKRKLLRRLLYFFKNNFSNFRSLAGYRIPNRRISEKEKDIANNNKIMPIIDSMVYTACKEYKDSKNAPETPSGRRGRHRLTSPEVSRERKCMLNF